MTKIEGASRRRMRLVVAVFTWRRCGGGCHLDMAGVSVRHVISFVRLGRYRSSLGALTE